MLEALLSNIEAVSAGGVVALQYTLVRLVQFSNVFHSISLTLPGMIMLVNEVQFENTAPPIEVTPFGIIMLFVLLHSENA